MAKEKSDVTAKPWSELGADRRAMLADLEAQRATLSTPEVLAALVERYASGHAFTAGNDSALRAVLDSIDAPYRGDAAAALALRTAPPVKPPAAPEGAVALARKAEAERAGRT